MNGPRLNPNLKKTPLYIAGRSVEEVKDELGLETIIKMASNESPVGPSPMAINAAMEAMQIAHLYPGIYDRELRRKLANRLGTHLEEQNIVTGNGGTDILRMITQAFVFDGGNTVMSSVTFPMYHILTTSFGGTPKQIDTKTGYRQDLDAMADQIDEDTRIVYLCSPNNPTGDFITQSEMDDFIDKIPEYVVVVVDESYCDYVNDPDHADTLVYIAAGRNLFSIRSFSKISGLANMRVGYLVGPSNLANYVERTKLPFHTSDIVLIAATASLDDETYHEMHVQRVIEGRNSLYSSLCKMNLNCLPSHTNFLTIVDPPMEVQTLVDSLLRKGVIVRGMASFGLPNGFRVSLGSPEDNLFFIEALREVLEDV